MRYATIVADPPWPYKATRPKQSWCRRCGGSKYNHAASRCQCATPDWRVGDNAMPYKTMGLGQIAAMPVEGMAEDDAHLYLWTTQRFLRDAYEVAECWGFRASALLVWSKPPQGMGRAFVCSAEFVIFARRGSLKELSTHVGSVFHWPRAENRHSAKPDAFLDIVEQVSPGPYVELFARRERLGWDSWGDESANTAQMPASTAA